MLFLSRIPKNATCKYPEASTGLCWCTDEILSWSNIFFVLFHSWVSGWQHKSPGASQSFTEIILSVNSNSFYDRGRISFYTGDFFFFFGATNLSPHVYSWLGSPLLVWGRGHGVVGHWLPAHFLSACVSSGPLSYTSKVEWM